MTLVRAALRALVAVTVTAALLAAPVVRAFAEASSVPARQAVLTSAPAANAPTDQAHRAPRLRRPKPTLAVALASSGPVLPAPSSSRRAAPAALRTAHAPSRAALPEHPPA
jgi:hypothetical protein